MSFKTILVPLSGGSEDRRCLDAAYQVAKEHGAHIIALFVEVDPQLVMTTMSATGFYFMGSYYEALERTNSQRRAEPHKTFDSWRKRHGISVVDAMADPGDVTAELVFSSKSSARNDYALVADLIVCPIFPNSDSTDLGSLQDALFGAGRPILAVPTATALTELSNCSAAIAWNGSREAARALTSALPLLRRARELVLLHVGAMTQGPTLTDVQTFLARHLLDTRIVDLPSEKETGEALLNAAAKERAGLLVLGAYSHSRAREFVFGGVTRDMLTRAEIPLLLSH